MTRVAVVGLESFGRLVAQALADDGWQAEYVEPATKSAGWLARGPWRLGRADVVYAIGSSIETRSPLDLLARARNPRIVMHWVGTDVEYAVRAWDAGSVSPRLAAGATHWTDAPWLAEELKPLGICASVQQLPGRFSIGSATPMPEAFAVLVYLPAEPHSAYDVEGTLAVMSALPGVRFVVVGGFSQERLPSNAEARGFVSDMASAYTETCGLLRLVRHDGMAVSVLEALSFGRRVAWNYPFEGVDRVDTPADAVRVISGWQEAFTRGELSPAAEASAFVNERYHPDVVIRDVSTGLKRLIS